SVTLRLSSDEHIQEFHSEISFFVRTFFYVYLGLIFEFDTFQPIHLAIGLLIIVAIVVVRRITSLIAWKIGDLERGDADALFAMMPRGLAAAVLATMPATLLAGTSIWLPKYNQMIVNIVLIVILGTTILASVLSYLTEKRVDRRNRQRLRTRIPRESSY
ncbi:MAG: cation:proton antiporter, partial [Thermoplasmata archaeon]